MINMINMVNMVNKIQKPLLCFFLPLLALLFLFSSANAQSTAKTASPPFSAYILKSKKGTINWRSGIITATGTSTAKSNTGNAARKRAMAMRAATVTARRNLLTTIEGIQITARSTIKNAMQSDKAVQSRIHGLLQNCQIVSRNYAGNGSAQVEVSLSLYGSLSDIFLPDATQFGTMPFVSAASVPMPSLPSQNNTQEQELAEKQASPLPAASAGSSANPYTGLIVDARRIHAVRPALSPQIVDEQGALLYGAALLNRHQSVEKGMAQYVTEPAWSTEYPPLIADNPFVARAVTATGAGRTTVVISKEQAKQIRALPESKQFLSQARVVIILDPAAR